MNAIKYPSTPHLPWSCCVNRDDKSLADTSHFKGKRVVVTEKMDGENTTMMFDRIHARSLDSRNHPSRNWVKGLWGSVRYNIPEGWRICGENLYAEHSIRYTELESYFYGFSVWNNQKTCLAWDDTVRFLSFLGLKSVPVLYDGVYDEDAIKALFDPESDVMEGIVVRLHDSFHHNDFAKSIAKAVRENHVQTDEHWMHADLVPNLLKEKWDH